MVLYFIPRQIHQLHLALGVLIFISELVLVGLVAHTFATWQSMDVSEITLVAYTQCVSLLLFLVVITTVDLIRVWAWWGKCLNTLCRTGLFSIYVLATLTYWVVVGIVCYYGTLA